MSHTSFLNDEWIAIHDGDYRGDVILRQIKRRPAPEGDVVLQDVTLPSHVLFSFVAGAVRHLKVTQIGDATDNEILGIK